MNTKTLALGSAIALALGISSFNSWAEDSIAPAAEATQAADDATAQEPVQVITADKAPVAEETQKECIPRDDKDDDAKESDDDDKDDDDKDDDKDDDDKDDDVKQGEEKSDLPYCDEEKTDDAEASDTSSDDKPTQAPEAPDAPEAPAAPEQSEDKPAE